MRLFNPYREILSGETHYEGSRITLPAGEEDTFAVEAFRDRQYGVRRILFNTETLGRANLLTTLEVGRRRNEWQDVHAQTVQTLYNQSEYEPTIPVDVPAGEEARVVLRNESSQELPIRIITEIMEPRVYQQRLASVKRYVGTVPDYAYAYAFSQIPPNTRDRLLGIDYPAGEWAYGNFAFFPTATGPIEPSSVLVEQLAENETVIERTRGAGFLDFNENRQAPAPIKIGPRGPIQLRVTNNSAETVILSALLPLFEQSALPEL